MTHGHHCTLYDFSAEPVVLEERILRDTNREQYNDEFRAEKAKLRWVITEAITPKFLIEMAGLVAVVSGKDRP